MFIKNVTISFYIYMYAFSRRFYPKRLTVHSGYTFFDQYVRSLGIEPTTFCSANAMLYHTATGTGSFILIIIIFFYTVYVWKAFCCSMKKPHPVFPLDAVLCCVLAWATSVASASVHLMLLSDLILSLSFPSTGISWPVSIQSMTGSTSSSTPFPCSLCLSPNCLSSTGSVSLELISTDKALIFNTEDVWPLTLWE